MSAPNFEGHIPRDCGDHATAVVRAWCLSCTEWCSPSAPCKGCEAPVLRDAAKALKTLHQIQTGPWLMWDDPEIVARDQRKTEAWEAAATALGKLEDWGSLL
jgi:hypothetical protein